MKARASWQDNGCRRYALLLWTSQLAHQDGGKYARDICTPLSLRMRCHANDSKASHNLAYLIFRTATSKLHEWGASCREEREQLMNALNEREETVAALEELERLKTAFGELRQVLFSSPNLFLPCPPLPSQHVINRPSPL